MEEIIDRAVYNGKVARGDRNVYIFLDIGPMGELLEPMGTLSFEEAYRIFKRQVLQGVKSGVDGILIETMTDLYEIKAAILAAKENSDLPVFATMSFEAVSYTHLIRVKNFNIFYVVIEDVMETRRILYNRRDLSDLL